MKNESYMRGEDVKTVLQFLAVFLAGVGLTIGFISSVGMETRDVKCIIKDAD